MDDVGVKVRKMKHLKLHGKMLLADGVRAIVGSINLAPGSFDSRRELAIEVRDDDVVSRLHKIVQHDWKHSHPLDLSDAGLLADLEDRQGVKDLAIPSPDRKPGEKAGQEEIEARSASCVGTRLPQREASRTFPSGKSLHLTKS